MNRPSALSWTGSKYRSSANGDSASAFIVHVPAGVRRIVLARMIVSASATGAASRRRGRRRSCGMATTSGS